MNGANREAVLEPCHIPVTRFPVGLRSCQVVGQVLTRVVGRLAVKVKALEFPVMSGFDDCFGPMVDTACLGWFEKNTKSLHGCNVLKVWCPSCGRNTRRDPIGKGCCSFAMSR